MKNIYEIRKNIREGFALPMVVVFIGTFFLMATVFFLSNQNQRPIVETLDRSAVADYLALGMAEVFKLKVKEFPEEFRDAMRIIEQEVKAGKDPWPDMYLSYTSPNPETDVSHFFHDFKVKKNAFNTAASDAWEGNGAANAWDASWHNMFHYMFFSDNNPKYADNEAFKTHFKNYIGKYNVIVNLKDAKRVYVGLNSAAGSSELLEDIIQLDYDSEYRNSLNVKTRRTHQITFKHKRKFSN